MATITEKIVFKPEGIEEVRTANQTLETTRNTLAGISAASAAFAAAGVAAISELTGAYGVQERAERQLEQRLKSTENAAGLTAEELKNMASELQNVTEFGDEATIGAQSLLLTFTSIGRDVFPRAIETIQDMSVAMDGDLKGSTIQLGKALNDPIVGISALSRVGVAFTEDQKAMIKTMVEANNIAGAQTIILDELAKEFGGSAAAAAQTFSGQVTQINNALNDMLEVIGKAIAEQLTPFVAWFKQVVPVMAQFISDNAGMIAAITLTGTALASVTAIVTGTGVALATLSLSLGALKAAFATTSAFIATTLGPGLLAMAPAIAGIGLAIAGVIVFWDEFKVAAQFAINAVSFVVGGLGDFVAEVWSGISEITTGVIGGIKITFEALGADIKNVFADIGAWLKTNFPVFFSVIAETVDVMSKIFEGFKFVVTSIFSDIGSAAAALAKSIEPIVEAVKVIAGVDLSEDIRGEKMLNRSSSAAPKAPAAAMAASSQFTAPVGGSTFAESFDNWAKTTDGQRFAINNPSAFQQEKQAAVMKDIGKSVAEPFKSYASERYKLQEALGEYEAAVLTRDFDMKYKGSSLTSDSDLAAMRQRISGLQNILGSDAAKNNRPYNGSSQTVSLDDRSIQALSAATNTNGATYQKTRYAY